MKSFTSLFRVLFLGILFSSLLARLTARAETPDHDIPEMLIHFNDMDISEMDASTDRVMGGISTATLQKTEEGKVLFSGDFSLENNGGFTSLWFGHGSYDLSAADGIRLRVKGDGRPYHLQVETDERYRGEPVSFRASFETVKDQWLDVQVSFEKLTPFWRGRRLKNPFDPSKVETFGVILLDKTNGPFSITLAELGVY